MRRLLAANNLHSRSAFIALFSSAMLFSQAKDAVQGVHSPGKLKNEPSSEFGWKSQHLHNRAHAIIENARIKDEWSSNWLSVENLIRFDRSVMAYKILNKLSPESLWDKYQYRSAYSNYITRNCKDLQIPRLKTDNAKKGFYYSALKAWNDIPANI